MKTFLETLNQARYLIDHTFPDYFDIEYRIQVLQCYILLLKIKVIMEFLN